MKETMTAWFKPKSKLQELEKRYTALMRRSFKYAVKDPKKSRRAKAEAERIFTQIKLLQFKQTGQL